LKPKFLKFDGCRKSSIIALEAGFGIEFGKITEGKLGIGLWNSQADLSTHCMDLIGRVQNNRLVRTVIILHLPLTVSGRSDLQQNIVGYRQELTKSPVHGEMATLGKILAFSFMMNFIGARQRQRRTFIVERIICTRNLELMDPET
jgi:hypothetical protein